MQRRIPALLLTTFLVCIAGAASLYADDTPNETIEQKAKAMLDSARQKAAALIEDANVKADELIKKAQADAAALRQASAKSAEETTDETKKLAEEALEKVEKKGNALTEKTKSTVEVYRSGAEEKYIYTKEAFNDAYAQGKAAVNDAMIHAAIRYALLMSPDIRSMKIDVDVTNGIVELFGKVQNAQEAQTAMQIALSTKGVRMVKAFMLIQN